MIISLRVAKKKLALSIEIQDTALLQIVDKDALYTVLGTGYYWTEGPLWIDSLQCLLFSDVPANTIYKWSVDSGITTYLTPSGYTGDIPRGGEPGSNGLLLNSNGELILCQHGDRQIAKMRTDIGQPSPSFITIGDSYLKQKLNSPNDIVEDTERGRYYFTDPPYGLNDQEVSKRELSFNGVYSLDYNGDIRLLVDSLTRPNGIALMPGGKKLIVSNSDAKNTALYCFYLNRDGAVESAEKVFDFTPYMKSGGGVSDGLKIDEEGNVFASGPQGIWIFDRNFKVLGRVLFDHNISNCFLAMEGKVLFVTGSDKVMMLRLRK